MTIETINLSKGNEQFFTLIYNRKNYKFNMRFNDFNQYWFFDLTNNDTQEEILMGQALFVNNDAFSSRQYLGLGNLLLIDTDPNNVTPYNVKTDFGGRLALVRNF